MNLKFFLSSTVRTFFSFTIIAHTAQAMADVVINEIHYHPPSQDQAEEFIELHNAGTSPVELNGWRLEVGIDFIFEGTSVIEPGGFQILARSAAGFMTAFPAFNGNLIGEFDRNLGNGGDRIDLRDGAGQLIDTVSYLDEAPWPEEADGNGPSLELIHPRLDNSQPESWRSSLGSPTPGSENSVYQSNPRPIISEVKHTPLAPKPSESIRILARISDNEIVSNAHVYWRVAAPTETVKARFPPRTPNPTTQPAGFAEVPLFDDGAHGDGLPGDGLFGATLPPQPDKAVIEFTLTAADASGQSAQFPEGSPDRNALIQVDSAAHPENIPLFRIVMTPRDLETLRTRGVFNNELLNCTLIAQGGAFYQQGIRYRGSSSRVLGPRESFRIEIGENQTFAGLTELNFNGNGTLQQTLAWDLFAASEISNPFRQVFNLVLNNDFYPNYFQIESIDTPFLESNFGDDHGGNLYRGVEDASLEYLGPDPTPYRVPYEKKNNRAEDDYSDLIALTQTFSLESDAAFTEEIQSHIDVRQWLKYFAINSVLANSENGIQLNSGDDYFLYRREEDNRFVILPWDLDGTFGNIGELLFRQKLPAIVRLVQNPEFVRLYYLGIEQALDGPFYPDVVERLVDAYRGVFTNQELDGILFIETARRNFLLNQYPRDLTVEFPDGEIESVESCPRAVLSQDSIRLRGTSHAAYTVAVRVNGATAEWNPMEGRWSADAALAPGENRIEIESIDELGMVFERMEFEIFRADSFEILGGELTSDFTLTSASSPYRIASDLIVPSSFSLNIEPGTLLFLDEGTGIQIDGHINALGTTEDPIFFRPNGCGRWGSIAIQSVGNHFTHCEFYRASSTDFDGIPGPMTITLNAGQASIEDCRFLDCIRCLNVNGEGNLSLRDTSFLECELGVFGVNSYTEIENCLFGETQNGYDTVQLIGGVRRPSVIRGCQFEGGARDGIDLEGSDCLIFGNEIFGFVEGAGIRSRGPIAPLLVRNVISNCGKGVVLDPSSRVRLNHLTLVRNDIGIDLTAGETVAETTGAIRNTILWENSEDILSPDTAEILFSHSNSGKSLFPGIGNLSVNPLFADPDKNDFRLRANSPMIRQAENGLDIGAIQQSTGQRSYLQLR